MQRRRSRVLCRRQSPKARSSLRNWPQFTSGLFPMCRFVTTTAVIFLFCIFGQCASNWAFICLLYLVLSYSKRTISPLIFIFLSRCCPTRSGMRLGKKARPCRPIPTNPGMRPWNEMFTRYGNNVEGVAHYCSTPHVFTPCRYMRPFPMPSLIWCLERKSSIAIYQMWLSRPWFVWLDVTSRWMHQLSTLCLSSMHYCGWSWVFCQFYVWAHRLARWVTRTVDILTPPAYSR